MVNGPNRYDHTEMNRRRIRQLKTEVAQHYIVTVSNADFFNSSAPRSESPSAQTSNYNRQRGTERWKERGLPQLCIARDNISMGYVQEARENHVKKKVEEALRSKMKHKALKACDHYTSKYAECATGKTISVVWQCRKQAKELNECLHQYTNDSVLEEMKKEYALQEKAK